MRPNCKFFPKSESSRATGLGTAAVLILLCLAAAGRVPAFAQTPTIDLNDQSILQANPKRVGMNIGTLNYYDSGQMLKNLIGSLNPGFEPLIQEQIGALTTAGTTTSFSDPQQYDTQPPNYWAGGTFTVLNSQSGGAELGCTGTIASSTGPNYPPGSFSNYTDPVITVSTPCNGPFSIGDIVEWRMASAPTPESWWESSRGGVWGAVSGGGMLLSDTTDLCATCGTQSLELNASAAGSLVKVSSYFDAAPSFDLFVLMNGTYAITFWAKAAAGAPSFSVSAQRGSTGGFNCGTTTQALTSSWAQYTIPCTASETQATTAPGTANVTIIATGGTAYLDNLSFAKTGTDPTNTTVFRDEVIDALKGLYNNQSGGNPGMLRDWLDQNAETYANWTAPDYARAPTSPAGVFVAPNGNGTTGLSIEDYLVICQLLKVEPYLEVPINFSTADATSLIEFLAGPSTSAGGARRAALGQTAPWTSVFNLMHLTYCNECWNGFTFPGQSLPYRPNTPNFEYYYDYSYRAKAIFAAMRSSPYYSQTALELVMDAQTAVTYSMDTAITRAQPDAIEIEDYTYGNVSSFSNDTELWLPEIVEDYDKVIDPSDPTNYYQSLHDYQSLNACGASGTNPCRVNVYEFGSGTLSGSIDQKHLDYVTAGSGAGITTALLSLLTQKYYDVSAESYFALSEYQNNSLNGLAAKVWGTTVDMGGATNNKRPQYLSISLVDQSIIGPEFDCEISNNATFNFAGSATNGTSIPPGIPALNNVPYLFAFCFENGSSRSVVLINADLYSSHTVNFAGTNIPSGTVVERQYAPSSPDLLNEAPSGSSSNKAVAKVALTSTTLTDPVSFTLPPESVTALDFGSGTSTLGSGTVATPVLSLPSRAYSTPQFLTLSDTTPNSNIYYTTNDQEPTARSSLYTTAFKVSNSEVVRAIAMATGYTDSGVGVGRYTIGTVAAPPTFNAPAGAYATAQSVIISDATRGATIYYTTDGTIPQLPPVSATPSPTYSAPIPVTFGGVIRAVATAPGFSNSPEEDATYTIGQAATPTFGVASGTYRFTLTVSIKDVTESASIYYTTDGTTPTASSHLYRTPITVGHSETINAIAIDRRTSNSAVATATYTINK